MGVLVDILYGEKCCNKGVRKISYETCKQCGHKVALSKTFVTCYLGMKKKKTTTMTQEEKDLLIKDLCARLPYGVKCNGFLKQTDGSLKSVFGTFQGYNGWATVGYNLIDIKTVKPYLRPMSSMTEEEEREYNGTLTPLGDFMFEQEELFKPIQLYKNIPFELYEFFNSHHFDYRGLIEKDLALEAPEGMYK